MPGLTILSRPAALQRTIEPHLQLLRALLRRVRPALGVVDLLASLLAVVPVGFEEVADDQREHDQPAAGRERWGQQLTHTATRPRG